MASRFSWRTLADIQYSNITYFVYDITARCKQKENVRTHIISPFLLKLIFRPPKIFIIFLQNGFIVKCVLLRIIVKGARQAMPSSSSRAKAGEKMSCPHLAIVPADVESGRPLFQYGGRTSNGISVFIWGPGAGRKPHSE